jgi:hypothetical protein
MLKRNSSAMAPAESSARSRLGTATRPPLSATKGTGLKGALAAVSTRPLDSSGKLVSINSADPGLLIRKK